MTEYQQMILQIIEQSLAPMKTEHIMSQLQACSRTYQSISKVTRALHNLVDLRYLEHTSSGFYCITKNGKESTVIPSKEPNDIVIKKLNWNQLTPEDFERLIFNLISIAPGYENPEWSTKTDAADSGRDISVTRLDEDELLGTTRYRVFIQCKHWLSRSINIKDVTSTMNEIHLWEPPKVDILIFATSGRFTEKAVAFKEKNNLIKSDLKIEFWPESHLERILNKHPSLIDEFHLES